MTRGTERDRMAGAAACGVGARFNRMHKLIITRMHGLADQVALLVAIDAEVGGVADVALLTVLHRKGPVDTRP